MSSIEAATAAIKSLDSGEQFSYRQIAKLYGCDRTTLAGRHKHHSRTTRSLEAQNRQALHPQQEKELMRYIERLTRRGRSPTRAMIRNFGSQIARRGLGVNWVDRFVQRYPDELVSKEMTDMDNSRHKADLGRKYSLYFDLLREKIDQYYVEAHHTYDMDEKGFILGVVGRLKKIFSKALQEDGKRRSAI
jgi:hypothetical protein